MIDLPDHLVDVLADSLRWWHDNADPVEVFKIDGAERRDERSSEYADCLRKLRSLDEVGRALGPFMDADPSAKFIRAEWVNWRARVVVELREAGYRYQRGGKITLSKRAGSLRFTRRDLDFMKNAALKAVIQRDCEEIKRAFKAKCWKSAIILSGAAIEATLADALFSKLNDSKLTREGLKGLIEAAEKEKLIKPDVAQMSQTIRNYRNLVHAAVETRTELKCGEETAAIAFEVLRLVWKDLSAAS